MIPLDLIDLADVVGGDLARPEQDGSRVVTAVTIDPREAGAGSLFVPLPGEHTDGHELIAAAVARGASAHLHGGDHPLTGAPGAVVVDDPADALLGLGVWVRDTVAPRVVAITGSQGKTATKDLVGAAAGAGEEGRPGLPVLTAPGPCDDDVELACTLCLLASDSQVLVTELGTRGRGHIAGRTPVVRPDIAVITSVGASRLGPLGSEDEVAAAMAELVEGLTPDGVAVLNADDDRVTRMARQTTAACVTYGLQADADWRAVDVPRDATAHAAFTAEGPNGARVEVQRAVSGVPDVRSALAALAVANELGVPLAAAAAALSGARARWAAEPGDPAEGRA